MRVVFALALLVAACGDSPFPAGHACESSEECADGLLCDYGMTPHVCSSMSTTGTDLALPSDGPTFDLSVGDLPAAPDLSAMPDLVAPPTDL